MKLSPSIKEKAKAIIDGRSLKNKTNREALEALANEMSTKSYVSRKGFAGRGENNFEVNGEVVDKKKTVGKLEDGIYMTKGGVTKKMKTRNKLGAVICVTYRTLAKKDKSFTTTKTTAKAQAKKEAPKKGTANKTPAKKETPKKAPTKKVPAKKAPAKTAKAEKGKTKGRR